MPELAALHMGSVQVTIRPRWMMIVPVQSGASPIDSMFGDVVAGA